jgi:p-aminobenzoyl-glutamate transporter AbgT
MRFSRAQIIGALLLLGLIWLVAIIRLLIFSGS